MKAAAEQAAEDTASAEFIAADKAIALTRASEAQKAASETARAETAWAGLREVDVAWDKEAVNRLVTAMCHIERSTADEAATQELLGLVGCPLGCSTWIGTAARPSRSP